MNDSQRPIAEHDSDRAFPAAGRNEAASSVDRDPVPDELFDQDRPGREPVRDDSADPSHVTSEEPAGPDESVDLDAVAAADPRTRAELYGALVTAEADRDEYLDDLRRARAEFDNYRRRVMREGTTQRDAGKADAVLSLLEVLDDLDRTLDATKDSDDPSLAKGVQLVASKLVAALESHGLARIDALEVPFDPNEHEAVQQVPGDGASDSPTVAQVLRPGYRLGDRVLRPAMVVIAQ